MKRKQEEQILETLNALGVEEIEERLEISPVVFGDAGGDEGSCDCCCKCSKPIGDPRPIER